ncbi:MAG: hypothetical protein L3J59_02115 [Methylococcaceae bacterium]|nr:hypothetical protein [Methylococcaceae bacterium]
MESKRYPRDIDREQFEQIKPILESAQKRTKPRTVDLYDMYSVDYYMSLRRVANGGNCPRIT